MDWGTLIYIAIGFIVFLVSMFIAMNTLSEFKKGIDLSGSNSAMLFFIGAFCGALWPFTVPLGVAYYAYTWLLEWMLRLNDKRFQDWIAMPEYPWLQALYDSRTKENARARCVYCRGPLEREQNLRMWKPCEKVECQTLLAMDTEAKEAWLKIKEKKELEWELSKTAFPGRPIVYPYPNTTTTNPYHTTTTNPYPNLGTSHGTYHASNISQATTSSTVSQVADVLSKIDATDEYLAKIESQDKVEDESDG